ncbi:hypothetical protein KIH41_03770 [Litoribacter ruber]|uniref:DUF6933 domain-containing protein n=1 Tax=Litoribacter ruber TaxID=702568 RepID=UPI001BDB0C0D|nr:hypothetical protein [Litoribacter ruber]MBT0810392.1 hypothetical protein [Litoribacter ruber]
MQEKSDIVSLYFSKKLKGMIGTEFFDMATVPEDNITDEFYRWYGDIFYVNRKKYLIFSNGLTKFSFVIPDFRVEKKSSFFRKFCHYLTEALKHHNHDPEIYSGSWEFFSHDTIVNRSAMAHLSQLKDMCEHVIKIEHYLIEKKEELEYLNHYVNNWITTYKDKKGYHKPKEVFVEELEKRGLLVEK